MPQDSALLASATGQPQRGRASEAPPRLLALATAVPPVLLRQAEIVARAGYLFDRNAAELERLLPAFANAGIATRYSCVPLDWYERPHSWAERNRLYIDNALDLLDQAATDSLARAGLSPAEIDAVVTVSTTGIATPSLDARLVDRLGLRPDVVRLPIFGLGCAGGVLGLARAAALARALPEARALPGARATPGARVLLLVVELCALTFRRADQSKSNIIAAALFGDGAAAAIIGPADGAGGLLAVAASGEHTWPDSLDVMGWQVEDDGLGVLFSRDIPNLVRGQFRPALDGFLARQGLTLGDVDGFVCHPGGAKVIAALEETFGVPEGRLRIAREVLRDYGNMSAATVLFVLERMLRPAPTHGDLPRRLLMTALGPGFTAAFQLLERRP
jgi:alkylresorcinol/alkylpyrone synthase